MCDQVLRDKIIAKVNALTGAHARFTAWDVTRLLRQDGEWARHNEVRTEVHILFEDGDMGRDYLRTNVCIDGSRNIYAHVFHDNIDNPSNYDQNGLQTTPTGNNASAVTTPTAVVSTTDPDILTTDTRGRILIPKRFTQQVGLNFGDAVHCYAGAKNDIYVVNDRPYVGFPTGSYRRYMVDKYGDVRFRPADFNFLGSNFEVAVDGKNIILTPA